MKKWYHFIEYPERVLTRQERIIERRGNKMDLRFAGYYAIFLLVVFSAISIGTLFGSKTAEIDERDTLHAKICLERKDSLFCIDRQLFDRYFDASIAK
jgi:hypothetical protein